MRCRESGSAVQRAVRAVVAGVHVDETVGKRKVRTVVAMEVTLVRWPDEAERREQLRHLGHPRVLLLQGGSPPPTPVDDLEDWVRAPASEADLRARVEWLTRRLAAREPGVVRPVLDGDGLLRTGQGWVPLPPVESRLAAALLDRFGAVVSRDTLSRAGWPAGAPGRNALDVHVLRLRRRLSPIGLAIRTVRSRGYVLELSEHPLTARRPFDRASPMEDPCSTSSPPSSSLTGSTM